jgi:hypothetical protein
MDTSKINPETKEKMFFKSEATMKIGCNCLNIPKIVEADNSKQADQLMLKWACHYLGVAVDDGSVCAEDREILVGNSDLLQWTKPDEIPLWKWQDEMLNRSLVKRTHFD